jgi:hypothetical protein
VRRRERAKAKIDVRTTSCIFSVNCTITEASIYREAMSGDQETLN